jgi:hypothetical protein
MLKAKLAKLKRELIADASGSGKGGGKGEGMGCWLHWEIASSVQIYGV